ncbi:alpha/beta hydrolase [Chondromyces apiculatus]|uniref:Uncharacterized protein n=1 Tax=Chondromyces apiculatus DSM 436 TaxID=1192034 RepID=A0A017ST57_9BACT|nr:alpha/beta hydrolase [Chondromyces apiculatus]EYF00134.1 Hypothetical protein CAP_1145 [Chondromyces apiculatus DSM 436]
MAVPRPSAALLLVGSLALPCAAGCSDEALPGPWEDCYDVFECAHLEVPLDHEAPSGPTLTVSLLRRPADQPHLRRGSLVVNPGGPWGSGTSWVRGRADALPPTIRALYDVVGFDPRGSGESEPGVDCIDDIGAYAALDLTPDDAAEREAIVASTDALVAGCSARSGDLLPYMGTDQVARDLDQMREALGDEKLTFLGFSYGTFLGAVYADLFPDRVRALVLDAALDPTLSGEEYIRQQGLSFEAQLDDFLSDCADDASCPFHADGDSAGAYDAIRASVEAAPMPASDGSRMLGPGEFAYGVASALYSPTAWRRLARALALAGEGDATGLLELSDGYLEREDSGAYGNGLEVYYAVTSVDGPFATEPSVYEDLVAEMAVTAPRLGVYFPYTAFPSARWPVSPWRSTGAIRAEGAPPILVVGTSRDPATPYAWSVALAEQLESGVLLTREGQGHAAFLKGNACIDGAITRYLVDGVVPEDGTVCR